MRQHIRVLSILILSSLLILSGCGVSIGPQTKTEWVITRPGHPAQVLKAKNTFEDAMGTKWNDPEAKADYLKLRNEIKGLQARIEEMV